MFISVFPICDKIVQIQTLPFTNDFHSICSIPCVVFKCLFDVYLFRSYSVSFYKQDMDLSSQNTNGPNFLTNVYIYIFKNYIYI